jgi:hypothetical protein
MADEFSGEPQNENDSHKSNSKRKNKRRIKKDQVTQMRLSSSTQASFLSVRCESSTMGSHFSGMSEKENSQGMPPRILQKTSAVQKAKA